MNVLSNPYLAFLFYGASLDGMIELFLVSFGMIASERVGIIPVEGTDWEGKGIWAIVALLVADIEIILSIHSMQLVRFVWRIHIFMMVIGCSFLHENLRGKRW